MSSFINKKANQMKLSNDDDEIHYNSDYEDSDDDVVEEEEDDDGSEIPVEEDEEEDEEEEIVEKEKAVENPSFLQTKDLETYDDDDDDEEQDDDVETYLQKFSNDLNKNYLVDMHPEAVIHNEDEILALTKVVRDSKNNIIDDLHTTIPYLTKYERTRILGQRAKQINTGAKVFVRVPEKVIDGYSIAELELKEKRIPFIIRRPIPGGGCEYWKLKDLEVIDFNHF